MTEPYVGEIQLFGFPFAPAHWATCNGQIMAIQQNTTLFALIGTLYGGDGRVTFALPNFGGMAGDNQGQGPGLTQRFVGEMVGEPNVNLLVNEMPMHTHAAQVYLARGVTARVDTPVTGCAPTNCTASHGFTTDGAAPNALFNPMMLAPAGGGQSHPNQQPFLAVNYSIALQGVFPSFG